MIESFGFRIGLKFMVLAFLGTNLWLRFSTLFDYSLFLQGVFFFLGLCCLGVIFLPRLLKVFLFLFGVSFFLFGFRAYDIPSQVFEMVVVFVVLTVWLVNLRNRSSSNVSQHLFGLMVCYVALSAFSLMLLPLGHILNDFWLFGWEASARQVSNATPNSPLYALGGFNRLLLYSMLSFQLALVPDSLKNFKLVFAGIFSGAVFCAIIGLLDFSGLISLQWYRLGTTAIPGILHSTFLNRGWFSEFILSAVPFVLIGFISPIKYRGWKIMLFVFLVICEVVLILAGARAGWVSYPLVLFICWLFFYFVKDGGIKRPKFGWWNLVKVAVSVPITIGISLLLVFQVMLPLSNALKEKSDVKDKGRDSAFTTEYLKKNAVTMLTANASSRPIRWKQGFNVGRENPIFGMGYESYRWHADILPSVEGSYCNRNVTHGFADTPHCIFYQLFVSGGIVGLCLWMMIILFAITILIVDLVRNQRLLNIPVVISIISFHMYGIFQSMQYVPMIWSMIFLCLGYAMTIDEKVLPERLRRITGMGVKVMIFLVLIGGVVYFSGRGSQGLADKYGLKVYAANQGWDNYLGFHDREKGPNGYFRWSEKKGLMKIPEDGFVEIRVNCATPGLAQEPVTVDIRVDDEPIERIVFETAGSRKWYHWLGGQRTNNWGVHEILIDVSRTWNPKKLGISSDGRDLGVAVSEPKLLENIPRDGVGFYGWETLDTQSAESMAKDGKEKRFRWTGKQASEMIAECGMRKEKIEGGEEAPGLVFFLQCMHPDIEQSPVVVKMLGDGELLRSVEFSDYGWKQVEFAANELKGKNIITYEVSRTWNPKRMGVSGDDRELGVAVKIVGRQF